MHQGKHKGTLYYFEEFWQIIWKITPKSIIIKYKAESIFFAENGLMMFPGFKRGNRELIHKRCNKKCEGKKQGDDSFY